MTDDPAPRRPDNAPKTMDKGLQLFMRNTYYTMSLGLLISWIVYFTVYHIPALYMRLYGFPLIMVTLMAPFGFLMLGLTPQRIAKMDVSKVGLVFAGFSVAMGLAVPGIFWFIDPQNKVGMFLFAAIGYAGAAFAGTASNTRLDRPAAFAFMGGCGVVAAIIANAVLHATKVQQVFSIGGVALYTGITAWMVKVLRDVYTQDRDSKHAAERLAVVGALIVYLTFINLVQYVINMSFLSAGQNRNQPPPRR